jgi:hypothetical protein
MILCVIANVACLVLPCAADAPACVFSVMPSAEPFEEFQLLQLKPKPVHPLSQHSGSYSHHHST